MKFKLFLLILFLVPFSLGCGGGDSTEPSTEEDSAPAMTADEEADEQ